MSRRAHRRRSLATRLVTIGDGFRRGARFGAAAALVRAGLALLPGGDECHQPRLAGLNILGIVRKDSGRLDEAEAIYQEVLHGLTGSADPSLVALANVHHNLAGVNHARGHFVAGEDHAWLAIGYRLAAVGPDHPDVIGDRGVLGALLAGQGRTGEARTVFEEALAGMERHHGADHYEVAVVLNHLGGLDRDIDPLAAMDAYRRALAIKRRYLGARHPEIGLLRNNMGVLHRRQGRHLEAARCYQLALPVLRRRLGATHPTTIACQQNLARLLPELHLSDS